MFNDQLVDFDWLDLKYLNFIFNLILHNLTNQIKIKLIIFILNELIIQIIKNKKWPELNKQLEKPLDLKLPENNSHPKLPENLPQPLEESKNPTDLDLEPLPLEKSENTKNPLIFY